MSENIFKYAIFLTTWGWAGFAADQKGLRIFVLPEERKEDVLFRIRKELKCNNLFEDNRLKNIIPARKYILQITS